MAEPSTQDPHTLQVTGRDRAGESLDRSQARPEVAYLQSGAFSGPFQTFWDSTSLGLFKTCPRKYAYSMLYGWEAARTPTPLTFGILYHAALEHYDVRKAEGLSHEDAQLSALRYALTESGARVDGVWMPWESDDNNRNRFTLFRSVLDYTDHFADDPAETVILASGYPAVELSFQLDLERASPSGEPYVLCGHLDRLVEFNGSAWVMDRKTTTTTLSDYYFQRYSPDNQMSLYATAARAVYSTPVAGVIIDAAQILVGGTRFQRAFTNRTPEQLDEWLHDLHFWITQAEQCAIKLDRTGDILASYPMNDASCQKYGGCPFLGVCSRDPRVRENFLRQSFKPRVWDPSKPRGESA